MNLNQIKKGKGQIEISLKDFKGIYNKAKKPLANFIKFKKSFFVSLKGYRSVQFKILGNISERNLKFLKVNNFVNFNKHWNNIYSFLFYEFFQGRNFFEVSWRFLYTITLPLLLCIFLYRYSTNSSVNSLFVGILSSISIFIAIFTLFLFSQGISERKKDLLFQKGKVFYYFSVDVNMAELGVFVILLSIIGSVILPSDQNVFKENERWILILTEVLVFLCFQGAFILLRSIIEFYVNRPITFAMGDMKKSFLENFDKK